jgi:protease PrsW
MVDSVSGPGSPALAYAAGMPALATKPARPIAHRYGALYWSLFGMAMAIMVLLAFFSFGADAMGIGPIVFLAAIAAFLPVPIYVGLFLWLDRFEPEPAHLLAAAFAWGAGVAGFFACIANSLVNIGLASVVDPAMAEKATVSFSAPFMEETLKGLAVAILFFWRRDEFDGVLDGIIYAGMTALGFAAIENIQYYGKGMAEGLGAFTATAILRGMLSPYTHVIFTSMTGIGFGLARQSKNMAVKFIAPIAGWGCAMTLHFLWNTIPQFGGIWFLLAYVFFWIPLFLLMLGVIGFSLYQESKMIRAHLKGDGVLPQDADAGSRILPRLMGNIGVLVSKGPKAWNDLRHYQHAATSLAFYRYRVECGRVLANPSLENYYLGEMAAYRPRA